LIVGILQEREKPAPKRLAFSRRFWQTKKWIEKYLNQKKPSIIEHLAFLSVKHSVYIGELFQALVTAREKGTATCENLTIKYRGRIGKEEIFLITKDCKVVVQFRIVKEFLLTRDMRFESWMNTDKIHKQIVKQECGPGFSTMVQDLRHGMKKVTVEAEVLETPKPSIVFTRYGNNATVTNAWIADETGKIKLCLWNEQANSAAVGDTIQIKNASVYSFKGERQLRLGRTGTISVLQSCATKAKHQPQDICKNLIYA
jgi:replication factor A1